jgi:type IV pilus assembly protein PilM
MGLSSLLNLKSDKLTKLSSMLSTQVVKSQPKDLPIAIDFGTGALKILQLAGGDPPTLVAAAGLDTPADLIPDHKRRLEFQLEALPKLIKRGGFSGKRAAAAIPAWQTSVKHIQFPRVENVPLAQLVEAAIPQQLGVDPSTLVYRFIEVAGEKGSGKIDVIIIYVGRDIVNRFMSALLASKVEPVGMHSEFICTIRAFDYLHRREGDLIQNSLYIDLGATTTKVMISHGRDLVFARTIDVGGYTLDAEIAKQCAMTEEQANKARLTLESSVDRVPLPPPSHQSTAADPEKDRRKISLPAEFLGEVLEQPAVPVGPADANLNEPLEILTDEIRMCQRYHASRFPGKKLDRVVFVGGEARHRGITQHLARALRLPAQVADPLARIARTGKEPVLGMDMSKPQPGWAVALGLCLAPTDL